MSLKCRVKEGLLPKPVDSEEHREPFLYIKPGFCFFIEREQVFCNPMPDMQIKTLFIAIASLGLALTLNASAQTPAAPPATEAADTTADTNAAPKIQFAETKYDFGKVTAGEVVKATFVFTNTGNATLELTEVHPGCGCTAAGAWDKTVAPGATGSIPLQVNTSHFNGNVTKSATVKCNDPVTPTVMLYISGNVWKPIEVNPSFASFNFPSNHVFVDSRLIVIKNNLEEPITLSDLESGNPAFKAEMKETEPGKSFQITITTVPENLTQTVNAPITVKTSYTNSPVLTINAMAMVQPLPPPTPAPATSPEASK